MTEGTDFSAIPPDVLADAFEALAEDIAIYDAEERLIACNKRYRDILAPISEMIMPGAYWRDLIREGRKAGVITTAAARPENWDNTLKRLQAGEVVRTEVVLPNGRLYQINYSPTKSGGFVVTRSDITDQRRAESIARDREALLTTILDTNPTPVVMAQLDDARIIYRSPAAAEIFGDVSVASDYYVDQAERDAYVSALRANGRVEDFVVRGRARNGDELMVSLSGGIAEYNGELCAVSSVTDLTELIEREELIRKVVESCPAPVLMNIARTGEILYKSPELIALFGDCDDSREFYVNRADRDGFLAALRKDRIVHEYKARFFNASGEPIWAAVSARLLDWDGEEVIVSCARDMTQQLEIEAELNRQREQVYQSEKMSALGSLLAGVAHELNNPLSVVVGHAMMLGDEVEDEDVLRQVRKIADAAERCSRIVKTFLTMARQEPTRMDETDINDVVQTAVDVVRYGRPNDSVRIETALDPETPRICADPDQLTQVVINIVLNAEQAIDASGTGDTVRIMTGPGAAPGEARLIVEDNGPGIPPTIRARVFEPFFTTKGVGEGTGIGLAMCHRIVSAHNGAIMVEDRAEGGARFVVSLPGNRKCAAASSVKAEPRSVPGSCRVLVVDDEVEVADLNAEVLIRGGYQAAVAYRAEDALELLRREPFDVVISDLNMPGIDGRGMFDAIRSEFADLTERTGFITGDTLGQTSQRFLEDSKRPFLEKPVSPRELREFVSQLSQREAR